MSATKKLLYHSIGDLGDNKTNDVRRIQQLLNASGFKCGSADGAWGKKTRNALYKFENRRKYSAVPFRPDARFDAPFYYSVLLEPSSSSPNKMAELAGILIPLPGKKGIDGVREVHQFFSDNKTPYNEGAQHGAGNRAIYGIQGFPQFAIQTNRTILGGRLEMDCTIYVNMMLSIYLQGNVHSAPYDAICKDFGGTSTVHCARDRYNFSLVKRSEGEKIYGAFNTVQQIKDATQNYKSKLHVMEVGVGKSGAVKHMALLYGNDVYECTTNQPDGACIKRSLFEFMANKDGKIIYLFREP